MASNRIKGITIEIDGNVTKLNNALSDVDKKLSTVKTSLRDVEKLLKLDPKNTELIAQKQKLLGEAISGTKTRLSELKKAQDQVTDPKEYDALQREIIATEQELKRLEKSYKDVGTATTNAFKNAGDALKKAGEKVKDFGTKAENLGKKMAPVSGAAAAIGAAAVKSAMDVDKGYDAVIKKTGATGKTLEDLKTQVDDVFTSLPTDAETAGKAVGDVNTIFKVTGKRCSELSKSFIEFADITEQDVETAIDGVADVMKDFNVEQEDAEKVMGILAKTSQKTGIDVGELTSKISTNSDTLKEMGLSLEESVTLLGQFEQGGVETSTALASLRKAQQKATKEGKSLKDTLKQSVSSIKNAKTETEALQIATDVFGKKGAATMAKAIREGKIDVDNLSASLEDYGDVVDTVYKETLDPWDEMKIAVNNLKIAGSQLAEELFKTLKPIIDKVVESVKKFTNWFSNLNEGQKQTIVKIGLLVAALAPALIIFGKVAQGIGSILTIGGSLIKGIGGLVGMLSGGGGLITAIGGLVTAIGPWLAAAAAVVAIGVAIYKNWGTIIKWGKKLVNSIKDITKKIGKAISDFGSSAKKNLSSALTAMGKAAKTTWNNIQTGAKTAWSNITTAVTNGVKNTRTKVSNGFTAVKTTITTAWTNIKTATSTAWANIGKAIGEKASSIKNSVGEKMKELGMAVSNAFKSAKTSIANSLNAARTTVGNAFVAMRTAAGNAKTAMVGAFNSLKTTVGTALNSIKSSATNAFNAIKNKYKGGFGSVIGDIRSKFSSIGSSIVTPFQNAWNTISKFPSKLKNLFSGIQIKLPKIKLPHLTVTWRQVGNLFKIPSIHVQWYKKAYEDAVIFNRPTVLQTGAGLKGFGDGNGAEVVLGMNKLKELVGAAGDTNVVINVSAPAGMNVNQLANEIERRLVNVQKQKAYSMT